MTAIPEGAFGTRVSDRLRSERVIWLTTVTSAGVPVPNPVWFLWEEPDTLVVYNRQDALRVGHVGQRPQVSLHFDGDGQGGDIVVITGTATLADTRPAPYDSPAYVAKYGPAMGQVSGSAEQFSAEYPIAMQITIDKVRGH